MKERTAAERHFTFHYEATVGGLPAGKRVRVEGLIVTDKPERYAEWRALAAPWVKDRRLKYRECVAEGLDTAPAALARVLRGANFGKMLVRVAPDA